VKWILRLGALAVIGVLAVTGVIIGCSGGSPAQAPAASSSSPVMTTPSHTATAKAKAKASSPMMPSASVMPSGSMVPTGSSGMTVQCDASNTSVTAGTLNGAAGTLYETLVIRNTGMSDCVTGGYSGLSLDNAMGAQLGPAAGRMGSPGSEVTIAPGKTAMEVLSYSDATVSTSMGCNPEAGTDLRVYLPNAMGAALVPFGHDGCTGMVTYLNVWAVNVAPGM